MKLTLRQIALATRNPLTGSDRVIECVGIGLDETYNANPLQSLFATGELARHTVSASGEGGQFFDNQEQLINALHDSISGRETLLIKGSRAQKMENVVAALVDNFRAA